MRRLTPAGTSGPRYSVSSRSAKMVRTPCMPGPGPGPSRPRVLSRVRLNPAVNGTRDLKGLPRRPAAPPQPVINP